jgi:hypothetical protein
MVIVDKGRRKFSIYRPDDPKIPPINSNPKRIFPDDAYEEDLPDESPNPVKK